jgi:hypothetical protein
VDGAVPLIDNPNFNLYQREENMNFAANICEELDRRISAGNFG